MYYPRLDNLNRHNIDSFLIQKIDIWLATRRFATYNYLSPLQFSLDFGINQEIAIKLFLLCTLPEINLLRERYVVRTPCCERNIVSVYGQEQIPQKMRCEEHGMEKEVNIDDIVIWFELLSEPATQPLKDIHITSRGILGKEHGLRPQMIRQSKDPTVRRLFDSLDERFRSA